MKTKSVRLAFTSLVVVLSVLGLSQAPADAKVANHHSIARTGGNSWCC